MEPSPIGGDGHLHGVFACYCNGVNEDVEQKRTADRRLVYIVGEECGYMLPSEIPGLPEVDARKITEMMALANGSIVFVAERTDGELKVHTYDRALVERLREAEVQRLASVPADDGVHNGQ